MKRFSSFVEKLDVSFEVVAGVMLAVMVVITLADVALRAFGRPIVGTIEIITFAGSMVIGFALPYSSWKRSHVIVDVVLDRLPPRTRKALQLVTKSMSLLLFLFISYNFILYGLDLKRTGEISPAFRIPYYPITYGLAFSCFLQSLTLFCDMCRIAGEGADK